jgi:hypothetical protein
MPPLPLNPDGTINVDQLARQQTRDDQQRKAADRAREEEGKAKNKKKSSPNSKKNKTKGESADTSDVDSEIKAIRDAMKEASGFKRLELQARLEDAEQERASRIEAAKIGAEASKYGSDKSLEGSKYGSDKSYEASVYASDAGQENSKRSLEGSKYGSDKSYDASVYASDAGERNSARSADASRYGSDRSLEGTRYSSDAGERNSARSLEGTKYGADRSYDASVYGADRSLEGTRYSSDAGERNSQRSLEGSKYGADRSLEGSKYGADRSLEGSKYGSDKSYAASIYGSDRSLEGSKYGADRGLEGTRYSADAGERNSARSLEGVKYGADASAGASRYGTDADLYKFDADQPLKRGAQALDFLKTYTDLSQRPDSFIQASNYARLGQTVEGMPGMLSDLLGNVNPNARPQGGNIAFRSGVGPMPQNAAEATFGSNPLNLGTRAAGPDRPVWQGPTAGPPYAPPRMDQPMVGAEAQLGTPGGFMVRGGDGQWRQGDTAVSAVGSDGMAAPTSGFMDGRPSVGAEPMGGRMMAEAFAPAQAPAYGTNGGMMAGGNQAELFAMSQGGGGMIADTLPAGYTDEQLRQSTGQPMAQPSSVSAPVSMAAPMRATVPHRQTMSGYGAQGGLAVQKQQGPAAQNTYAAYGSTGSAAAGGPRALSGRIVPTEDASMDAFKQGTRTLMKRGTHQWGNQALEKMTGTERAMLSSGIKDAGGNPDDYMESYARSRIGNEGAGRSL